MAIDVDVVRRDDDGGLGARSRETPPDLDERVMCPPLAEREVAVRRDRS
ncbi:MAG TPA: hypothetical protein VGQ84_08160 [Gaiellaceae bacterium]|nr:hypothetical protein [Gaiellaceae bacterium]